MGGDYVADYASAVLPEYEWVASTDWLETYRSHFEEFYSQLRVMFEAQAMQILAELPKPFFARAARCVHKFVDHQFQAILDSPVPELKHRIPRELVKTVKGQKEVSAWLKGLESQFWIGESQSDFADYDMSWMWKELGIEAHRRSSLF